MDDFRIAVLVVTLAIFFGGAFAAVSLIKNWPGRTPADPE